ncbi:MAG: hypothetical protein ACFFCZ_30150, partial [Promethearchaeota archaeon]
CSILCTGHTICCVTCPSERIIFLDQLLIDDHWCAFHLLIKRAVTPTIVMHQSYLRDVGKSRLWR